MELRNQVRQVESKCDKILSILETKLGPYVPPVSNEETTEVNEIIPDFIELKTRIDVKDVEKFAIEFLTSECDKSYEIFRLNPTIDSKMKSNCKSKFNKQKKAISIFMLFMRDIPEKPKKLYELGTWKGQMIICVKNAMKRLKDFISKHKMKKVTKLNKIPFSFLIDVENVKFINSKVDEINTDEGIDTSSPIDDNNNVLNPEEAFERAFQNQNFESQEV